MRRVVVTGYGIVSSIGNTIAEVTQSLSEGKSGIEFSQEYADMEFRSHVYGPIDIDLQKEVPRKALRFMGDSAAYSYVAMRDAIADSGLTEEQVSNPRSGLIVGVGGTSNKDILTTIDTVRNRGAKKVGPYMVPRTMGSSNSACLATPFAIKGINYTISSACATSSHCIGNGMELIQQDKQDIVFAGGGDEVFWISTAMFDAMGALSSKYNDAPETASRAYDANRDGFVISGGAGIVVLEEYEHAIARGATIHAELVGYGATSDGYNMVAPSGEGAVRCMRMAMENVEEGSVDYVNTHGTSTPAGDVTELKALGEVFGDNLPRISSTKSLTGHALGAAGVNEAIYSIIMMNGGFLAASANISDLDPAAEGFPIVREREEVEINTLLSNSFGFGGTNAALVFKRI